MIASTPSTSRTRTATCRCGQLSATCSGEPVRISVCHCHWCQLRSGSAFAWQARWPADRVEIAGEWREWVRIGESGSGTRFCFCETCGGTVFYVNDLQPDTIAVAAGGFADADHLAPTISVWEERKRDWVAIVDDGVDRE